MKKTSLTSLLSAVFLSLTATSQAANYTWTTTTNGTKDWNDTANWSGGTLPVSANDTSVIFFSDTTTALANGTQSITTGVPTSLSLNTLTLNGKGADAGGASNITIGTNASTWTIGNGTTSTVNLNGVNGAQALNYTVAPNLTLNQTTTTFTGNGNASFTFSGNITQAAAGYGITKSGTSRLTLSGNNTYSGGTSLTGGFLTLGSANALGSGNLTISGNATRLAITDGLTISNAISISGNTPGISGNGTIQTTGGGSVTLTGPINITGTPAAGGTFGGANGGAGTINVTGAITSSALINVRSGTLVLSGGGNYTDLASNGGSIRLGANNGTSTSATVDVVNSVFDLAGYNQTLAGIKSTANSLPATGGVIANSSTASDSTLTLTGNTGNFGSSIRNTTGSGNRTVSLTVNGGTHTLSGNNSYTGQTTVSAGALVIASTASLPGWNTSGNYSVASGATLGVTNAITDSDVTTILGTGNLNSGAAIGFDTGAGNRTYSIALADGAGPSVRGLTKLGNNTLFLTGNNTYTGNTTIRQGTLQLGNGTVDGSISSTTGIINNGTFAINSVGNRTIGNVISGTGALNATGANGTTLILTGNNTYTGNTSVSGTGFNLQIGNGTTDGSIASSGGISIATNSFVTFNVIGNQTITSNISGSATGARLFKSGNGTLTIAGTNDANNTTVNAGILRIQNSNGLGSSTTLANYISEIQLAGDIALSAGKTFLISNDANGGSNPLVAFRNVSGNNSIAGAITVTSGGGGLSAQSDSGLLTFSGNITTTSATRRFVLQGAANGVVSGSILDNAGNSTLTKNGAGTWTLGGANTYNGTTTINAGTLSVSNIVVSGGSSNLGNATSAVILGSNSTQGTLSYTGNNATYTRGFTIGGNGTGSGRLDVTTAGQTLTVGTGDISGNGSFTVGGAGNTAITSNLTFSTGGLTKADAGTLTLGGVNTYTGNTTVSTGTLLINGSTSASSVVSVASGATLGGNGTINGALTVSGTLSPGNSPGNLTVANSVTIADGGTMTMEINGTAPGTGYDRVTMTGSSSVFSLTGTNNLALSLGYTPANNALFFLVDNQSSNAISGIFEQLNGVTTDLSQNAVFNVSGQNFQISYTADVTGNTFTGGNDLALQAIPEPSTWLLLAGSLTAIVVFRRRRIH
jgi:autotransporter-associated beta strand protein